MSKQPAKILFLITELDPGGAERALLDLVVRLDRDRFEPHVACLKGRGALERDFRQAGVPLHALEMRGPWDLRGFARLIGLLGRERPRILHTLLFHANLAGRIAAWLCGTPCIVSAIRVCEVERRSHLVLDYWTHWMVDREICVGDRVLEFTHRFARLPREKLLSIPNGLDPGPYEKLDRSLRSELGVSEDAFLVSSVGRITAQKDPETLLDAAALVCRKRSGVLFAHAGTGERKAAFARSVEERGLQGRFRLLGWRSDVSRLLGASDLYVLTSRWEGMPHTVLEAMAAGVPVVATAVGSVPEMVNQGQTGLLVPPGSPERLAEAILRLADDPLLRRQMSERGRKKLLAGFTADAVSRKHQELYQELLDHSIR